MDAIKPLLDYFTAPEFLNFILKSVGAFVAVLIVHYIDNVKPGKSDNFILNIALAIIRNVLSKVDPAMIGRSMAAKHNPTSLNAARHPNNLPAVPKSNSNGANPDA